jgi:hypothetical protein
MKCFYNPMKSLSFLFLLLLSGFFLMQPVLSATEYTWTGAVSNEWGDPLNWSPSTGFPDLGDDVIINSASNSPLYEEISGLNHFTINSGSLNLSGFTILISGTATFNGGTISNGAVNCSGASTTFAGTVFASGVAVTVNSTNIYFNGGTFNSSVSVTKSGSGENISDGGNTFKGTFSLTNSGTGTVIFAAVDPDIFETSATFTNSGSGLTQLCYTASGNQFLGNVTFNSTGASQGIRLGQNGGTSTLSAGYTMSIGGSGFSAGDLRIKNFTQSGSTSQNLTLTSAAALYIESGNTFNGAITFSSPNVYLNGASFVSSASITKSGSNANQSLGGNTFSSTATFTNSGSGDLILGVSNPDTFTGVATFTNTGSGTTFVAHVASGTAFNHNIVVNSTGSSKGVRFGQNGGTSALANSRTITIGGSGFTAGSLRLRNFTQTGSTAQSFNVTTGSAALYLETGTTFNGAVTFTFPQLFLGGSTFASTATLQKRGATDNSGAGGCTFQGLTTITNSGSGRLNLGTTNPDIFNNDLTLNCSGSSMIQIAHSAAGTQFNGNIVLNSTGSSAGIKFGQNGGTSILADTKTITIGAFGFENGDLALRGFTQTGTTAQTITEMIYPASLILETGTTFNGDVTFSAPRVFLNGATFNAPASITKNSSDQDLSDGGNTFNNTVTIINSGDGEMSLGNINPDVFEDDLIIENISSDVINLAYASAGNEFNGNVELNSNGSAAGIRFGQNGGTSILASGKTISIGSSGFTIGDLRLAYFTQTGSTAQTLSGFGSDVDLYLEESTTFNGTVSFSSPGMFLNGATFNSNATLTKTGTGFNLSNGGNTFNGVTTISNTGSGTFILAGSAGDTFNENVTFNQQTAYTLYPAYNTNCFFKKDISTVGSNTAVIFSSNGGRVTVNGTGAQVILGESGRLPEIYNLTVNKSSGSFTLNIPVSITNNLTLTSGNLTSSAANLLTMLDNSTVTGVSNSSYVNGPVRKEGNDAFTFPVGKGGYYRPIGISAPSATNHHFTAEFYLADSDGSYTHSSKDASLHHLSRCEYWILNRTNGSSNVNVTLSWNTSSCGVTNLADLKVARWNGSQWKDHGNGGTSGNNTAGSVVTSAAVTSFSPFTLASNTSENPLPVNLLHFQASIEGGRVLLDWATTSENNSDYFSIESSIDAVNFTEVTRVSAAGNSNVLLNYRAFDNAPASDVSYYRLRQVDYDGRFMYSNVEVVNIPTLWRNEMVLSPNPVINFLDVRLDPDRFTKPEISIRDIQGREVMLHSGYTVDPRHALKLDLSALPAGLYFLNVTERGFTATKRVIRN